MRVLAGRRILAGSRRQPSTVYLRGTPPNRYVQGMTPASVRVRHIVELVAELSDDERSELETELQGQEIAVGRAWGEEIDRRAAHALRGQGVSLSRPQLTALLETDPLEARAQLSRALSSRG